VCGLCTVGVEGWRYSQMAGEMRRFELGAHAGSMARIAPGASVKQRKALRLRCQVIYFAAVVVWVALGNAVALLWWLVSPPPACRWSLHAGPDCADVDAGAVAALAVGAALLLRTLADMRVFAKSPLRMREGEEDAGCPLNNASPSHAHLCKQASQSMGAIVCGLEIAISVVPLPPIWYGATVIPVLWGGYAAAQRYFKM
jgi:hypothetical protein